jgi:outer membrane protein assembly factor BamB
VIGLNARTLEVDVNIALALPASCPAVSDRTFVFTGALDGKLFAYNIASQVLHWKSKVASAVTGLGVLNGNVIVCRSNVKQGRGELVAYRPGQKFWSEIWPHPVFTEGPVSAPIVVSDADQAIYVASEDRSLYKFNAVDGWVDWRCRTPGILRESPTLLANGVVQRIPGSGTWLVNRTGPDGGKPLWKDPGDLQYLGQAGQRIYFFDGRSLLCKDAATGKTLKSAEVRGAEAVISAPNPDQPLLYLVNQAGQVFCANDLNLPYLTPDMLR